VAGALIFGLVAVDPCGVAYQRSTSGLMVLSFVAINAQLDLLLQRGGDD
jgi:hypothetical protein